MWPSHHEERGSDGAVSPHVCDHRVVPKRGVVPDRCNPSGAAEDACGDALAWARRAERAADGGVLYVPQALSVSPRAPRITAQRIRDYLDLAGHSDDIEGPLFRPVRDNRKGLEARRPLHPDVIDRTLRKYARHVGLERGYSAHSMRATFITTALDNGASLEDVQSAAGHADPSTTKLYDRRGYNPEKSASFFANY